MRQVPAEDSIAGSIEVGDKIEMIDRSGRISSFTVGKVTAETISGTSARDVHYTIPVRDIEAIKVETVDGGKTALAVVGGVAALPFIVAGFASFLFSVWLYFVQDETSAGIFVGLWVPSIHSLGTLLLSPTEAPAHAAPQEVRS